jgi:hypothetical protein
MAENQMVLFKKGLAANLPSTRDAKTLYFVTDEGKLYLGADLIADKTGDYAKAISDAIANLDATVKDESGLVKVTIVEEDGLLTSVTVDDAALDQKLADDLKAAKDYTDQEINKITTGAGYATTKYVDETVATATTDMATNAGVDAKIQALDADVTSTAPEEAGKGIQVNVIEADGIITSVSVSGNYDKMYDALGAAATVLGNSNDAATANTVYGAKAAAAAAQSDATIAKTKIETFLGTVTPDGSQDIIDTLAEINTYVGEHGQEFAALSERVTKVENGTTVVAKANADKDGNEFSTTYAKTADISEDITKGVTAHGWGNHATEGYLKATDIAGKEDKSNLKALAYKDTIDAAGLINNKVITKEKLADAVQTSLGLADTSAQKVTNATAGHLAALNATGDLTDSGKSLNDLALASDVALLSNWKSAVTDGSVSVNKAISAENARYLGGKSLTDIQGSTTNSIKDCVDAINALNAGTAQTNKDINAISTSVSDVVNQLTWGTF